WEGYLKSEPAPLPYYARKAGEQLNALQGQYDTQGLNELLVESGRQRYVPEQCGAFIQKARDYLQGCYHRDRVEADVHRVVEVETRKADKLVYARAVDAVDAARSGTSVQAIHDAKARLDEYLQSPAIPRCREKRPVLMRSSAEGWLAWYGEISRGK